MKFTGSVRRSTIAFASVFGVMGAMLTSVAVAPAAQAHGSMTNPTSRIYDCFFGDRTSPMCANAWAANPQALYDWTEVNQPAANGNHRSIIPDGQLCSAGRSKYAAFDIPSTQWKATNLQPDADGRYTMSWVNTAPHATRYYRIYLTKADFDPTKPLEWDDLELVHDTGARALETTTTMRLNLPARTGRHMIYTVWQRSDSPEAFYSCSDVILDGSGVAPTPIPTPTPSPTPQTPGMSEGIEASTEVTSDWGSGYCARVVVSTTSATDKHWRVDLPSRISVSSLWDGVSTNQPDGTISVGGAAWNHMVKSGSPTSFGYCATRSTMTPAPTPTPTPTPTPAPAPTPTPTPAPTPTPTPGTGAGDAIDLPLRTSGNRIVDSDGDTVVWQGVNWFGLETQNQAPHGLWIRDYKDMLAQIADLGFNTIRVPFSLEAMRGTTTSGVSYAGGINADLQGKTPLQVLDAVIAEAGRQGLMVILDNHSQANDGFMDGLWFGQEGFTENDWVATWRMLAQRYRDAAHVVGYDLKNEPHGPATWGTGGATDWRRAAERAGNIVLAENPNALIIVEGIEGPVAGGQLLDRHWWGGNLEGVRNNPVRLDIPNRLVYSPHEYGPGVFNQPWFSDPNMTAILADRWEKGFGYIHTEGIAPIFVGEFGAKSVSSTTVEGRWIRQFTDYLANKGMSWTFWSWNPNSGDTGGVLTDDWRTVHADKMALLTAVMAGNVTGPLPAPEPTPAPVPAPSPTPIPVPTPAPTPGSGLTVIVTNVNEWGTGRTVDVEVKPSSSTKSWQVRMPWTSTISTPWNGVGGVRKGALKVKNAQWNGTIAVGRSASFGFNDRGTDGMPRPTTCSARLDGVKAACTVMVVGTR